MAATLFATLVQVVVFWAPAHFLRKKQTQPLKNVLETLSAALLGSPLAVLVGEVVVVVEVRFEAAKQAEVGVLAGGLPQGLVEAADIVTPAAEVVSQALILNLALVSPREEAVLETPAQTPTEAVVRAEDEAAADAQASTKPPVPKVAGELFDARVRLLALTLVASLFEAATAPDARAPNGSTAV